MDESVGVCVVKSASGVRKFEDLLQKETLFGGTGPSGGATQAAIALTRLHGAKIKLIKGYPGAQDVVLAMAAAKCRASAASPSRCSRAGWREKSSRAN